MAWGIAAPAAAAGAVDNPHASQISYGRRDRGRYLVLRFAFLVAL